MFRWIPNNLEQIKNQPLYINGNKLFTISKLKRLCKYTTSIWVAIIKIVGCHSLLVLSENMEGIFSWVLTDSAKSTNYKVPPQCCNTYFVCVLYKPVTNLIILKSIARIQACVIISVQWNKSFYYRRMARNNLYSTTCKAHIYRFFLTVFESIYCTSNC